MKQAMTEQMFAKAVLRVIMEHTTATTVEEAFEKFEDMAFNYGRFWCERGRGGGKNTDLKFCREMGLDYLKMYSDVREIKEALKK